jgi:hypothetical protein
MLFNPAHFISPAPIASMNSHRLVLITFAVLVVAGCRTRPEQRAVMDSYTEELRRYEGIIYDLEYDNEILSQENERLKQRLAEPNARRRGDVDTVPDLRPPRVSSPPSSRSDSGPSSIPDGIDLSPPVIEADPTPDLPPALSPSTTKKPEAPAILPEQDSPDSEPMPEAEPAPEEMESPDEGAEKESTSILVPPKRPPNGNPGIVPPKLQQPSEALPAPVSPTPANKSSAPELLPEPEDKKVSALYIDPHHTRGLDLDRQSGDDGLRVVIEPRNSTGQFVPTTGKVSVVVLDPSRPGEAARLGRWEFDADVVRYQLRLSGKRNIPLELPWTGPKPQSSKVTMFVRLETESGEQVEASRDVNVLLPGQISSRWTPRPAQRRGSLSKQVEVAQGQKPKPREVAPVSYADEAQAQSKADAATASQSPPEWKPYR